MGGVISGLHGVENGNRVDVPDAGGHGLCLGLAHGGGQGLQLAVEIGDGYGVAVYQRQLAHAGPGQTLGGIAAHAAQTE